MKTQNFQLIMNILISAVLSSTPLITPLPPPKLIYRDAVMVANNPQRHFTGYNGDKETLMVVMTSL